MRTGGSTPLLEVRELRVELPRPGGRREGSAERTVEIVRDLSFSLRAGEVMGLVGESGAGKSMTALALMGLLPAGARVSGQLWFEGVDLLAAGEGQERSWRGASMAMVFQEPMSALDPSYSIGFQLVEVLRHHTALRRRGELEARAIELLDLVAFPEPHQRLGAYPHQLSGGQRQRVCLAMALAGEPSLLIADEPTTALDVTVQAEILELLSRLRAELGLSILFVTHDLGVVARLCDRVMVLYSGELVEEAAARDLFGAPRHPYTRDLLAASPRLGRAPSGALPTIPGSMASPGNRPTGCAFHPRCREVLERCSQEAPELSSASEGRSGRVRCWLEALPDEEGTA